jgi:hypothetical protein
MTATFNEQKQRLRLRKIMKEEKPLPKYEEDLLISFQRRLHEARRVGVNWRDLKGR